MKEYYENKFNKQLYYIDLDRLCKNLQIFKKCVFTTKPQFIHGDINLSNVIYRNNQIYFIDTADGKYSFRALDFRGNCWYTWNGDNKKFEQAIYRGIYKGLFNGRIPKKFNKELAFTIIYEFLLKVFIARKTDEISKMEYIFNKFGDIFKKTNYFENYFFEWFN